ncbi:MAG: tetratricopeptide repeat protein [Thermoanaerobaculia bacterium]
MPDRPPGRRRRIVLLASALLFGVAGRISAVESDRELCSRFNDAGDYLQALAPCAAAVTAARSSPEQRAGLAAALNAHGLALEMTGEREAAEASYREALGLQRELGARDQEAIVLSNLAALAIGAGDYGRALGWLADEEAVARSAGDAGWVEEELRIVRINRSVAYEQLGAYREALAEIRPLVASDSPEVGHSAALAANLAVLYRNVGDPRRALRLLDRAGREFESAGDRAALANVHLNRGLVYALNLEQPDEARRELDRALELARETGDRAEELRTLQTLGDLELARGNTGAAREAFTAALGLARASGAAAGEWAARTGVGRVLAAERNPEAALAELQSAVEVLEQASGSVGDAELAGSLLRDQRRLFATAVDLLGERALAGDAEAAVEALAWSERLRARGCSRPSATAAPRHRSRRRTWNVSETASGRPSSTSSERSSSGSGCSTGTECRCTLPARALRSQRTRSPCSHGSNAAPRSTRHSRTACRKRSSPRKALRAARSRSCPTESCSTCRSHSSPIPRGRGPAWSRERQRICCPAFRPDRFWPGRTAPGAGASRPSALPRSTSRPTPQRRAAAPRRSSPRATGSPSRRRRGICVAPRRWSASPRSSTWGPARAKATFGSARRRARSSCTSPRTRWSTRAWRAGRHSSSRRTATTTGS